MRLLQLRRVLLVLVLIWPSACIRGGGDARHQRGGAGAPFGALEAPSEGAALPETFTVQGWAADDRGIAAVRIYLDGRLIGLADTTAVRPDVTATYPDFRHGTDRHGWAREVQAAPGAHTIRAEAVDIDRTTRDLGSRQVVVVASPEP